MFKHMLLGLGAASLLVVVTALPVQADHFTLPPLLDPSIVTRGDWQWVWVSPCVERERNSCSFGPDVDAYGFRPPEQFITGTSNPWTESFDGFRGDNGMLKAFGITENPNGTFSGAAICATPSFSHDYTDCQDGDLNNGAVFNAPFSRGKDANGNELPSLKTANEAEVFWVKAYEGQPPPNGSLPEPSSLLLLGAGLLGLAAWRWKYTV